MKKSKPVPRSTPINEMGKAVLRSLRAIPVVRNKVIPWLVREEIDQIPSAPILAAMRKELRLLSKVRGHVMVGPWLSEVGFELLYWIPFLRWAVPEFNLDPSRLIVVSRGGVAGWYTRRGRQVRRSVRPATPSTSTATPTRRAGRRRATRSSTSRVASTGKSPNASRSGTVSGSTRRSIRI